MRSIPFTWLLNQNFTSGETGPILFPRMLPGQRAHVKGFSFANSAGSSPVAQPVIERQGIDYVISATLTVTNGAASYVLVDFWLLEGDAFGFKFSGVAQTGTYTMTVSGDLYFDDSWANPVGTDQSAPAPPPY